MGGDIAAWCALRGFTVTLQDRGAEFVQPALDRARAFFEKRSRVPGRAAEQLARLQADVAGHGVERADVVIEAIFENAEAKRELYARLEPRMKPGAILATNTSSLMLEPLAERLAVPGRLVGLHFFNPVAQMPLVEVIESAATEPQARAAALAFTRAIDKLPLPCRSAPGFLVNRVLMPYMTEAMLAAGEGVPLATIDAVAVKFGMPMGPIELADIVGLDVCLHVGRILSAAFGGPAPDAVAPLVAARQARQQDRPGPLRMARRQGREARRRPRCRAPDDLEDRLHAGAGQRGHGRAARRRGGGRGSHRCRRDLRFGLRAVPRRAAALCAGTRRRGNVVGTSRGAGGAAWRPVPAGSGLGELRRSRARRDTILEPFAAGLHEQRSDHRRTERPARVFAARRAEEREPPGARPQDRPPRAAAGPPAVQGRRHRQAHVLPRERAWSNCCERPHRRHASAAARPTHAIRSRRSCRAAARRASPPTRSSTSRSTATCSTC